MHRNMGDLGEISAFNGECLTQGVALFGEKKAITEKLGRLRELLIFF